MSFIGNFYKSKKTIPTLTSPFSLQISVDDTDRPARDLITFSMNNVWYELPSQTATCSVLDSSECLYWETNTPNKQSYSKNLLTRFVWF